MNMIKLFRKPTGKTRKYNTAKEAIRYEHPILNIFIQSILFLNKLLPDYIEISVKVSAFKGNYVINKTIVTN